MRSPGCPRVYLWDLSSFYSPSFTFLPFMKTKLGPSGLLLTSMVLESLWRQLACWVYERWLLPERSSLGGTSFSCLLPVSYKASVRASASPGVAAERSTTVWHERCPYECGEQRCPGGAAEKNPCSGK